MGNTDNFQIRQFQFEGATYHSFEQAYQALKFEAGAARDAVQAIVPKAGESDGQHGMNCWAAGQIGTTRADWDHAKVGVMLAVNRATYAQHADLRAELLATADAEIQGSPSTTWKHPVNGTEQFWEQWSGRVQMLIREELRSPDQQRPDVLRQLNHHFDSYGGETVEPGPPLSNKKCCSVM